MLTFKLKSPISRSAVFASLLLLFPVLMKAQETQTFTLQQCIDFALQNSNTYKNARLDEQITRVKTRETRAMGLPQINGSVTLLDNLELSKFFMPLTAENPLLAAYASQLPKEMIGKTVALDNIFQLKNSGDANIAGNQMIFNGPYFWAIPASNTYKRMSAKATEQTRIQTVEQIKKAYYGVLINQERKKLFDQNVARLDSLMRITKALNQAGFAEAIDVSRVQVALNNIITQRDNFGDMMKLSMTALKFQMNYPMDKEITVLGDIKSMESDTVAPNSQDWKYDNRVEYQLVADQKLFQQQTLKAYYAGFLPTIGVFGKVGYSKQAPTFAGLFKVETPPIPAPLNAVFGQDKWYRYSMVGLSLNMPVFQGFMRNYQIQETKLNMRKAENSVSQVKNAIQLDVSQANISYNNSLKAMRVQRQNLDLATEVARVTKVKYQQGIGSNIEVIDAESDLRTAQVNYYQALYNLYVAKVDFEKALGTLK